MQINYIIKNYQFRETTKGKGIVKYHLVDDQGKERVVSAIATLGFNKKIKSVHPIHFREQPLIDALAKSAINDKIRVDFTEFNKMHPRGSTRTQKMTVETNRTVDDYQDSLINDLSSLKDNKFRLFKLFALSVLVLVAVLSVLNGFFS